MPYILVYHIVHDGTHYTPHTAKFKFRVKNLVPKNRHITQKKEALKLCAISAVNEFWLSPSMSQHPGDRDGQRREKLVFLTSLSRNFHKIRPLL